MIGGLIYSALLLGVLWVTYALGRVHGRGLAPRGRPMRFTLTDDERPPREHRLYPGDTVTITDEAGRLGSVTYDLRGEGFHLYLATSREEHPDG